MPHLLPNAGSNGPVPLHVMRNYQVMGQGVRFLCQQALLQGMRTQGLSSWHNTRQRWYVWMDSRCCGSSGMLVSTTAHLCHAPFGPVHVRTKIATGLRQPPPAWLPFLPLLACCGDPVGRERSDSVLIPRTLELAHVAGAANEDTSTQAQSVQRRSRQFVRISYE